MLAGSMEIDIHEDEEVAMTGPVATCYAGYLPQVSL